MAVDLATNERVAIKIINDYEAEGDDAGTKQYNGKMLQTFLNEIEMCMKARHRSIIRVIDFQIGGMERTPDGHARPILYYVMKFASYG